LRRTDRKILSWISSYREKGSKKKQVNKNFLYYRKKKEKRGILDWCKERFGAPEEMYRVRNTEKETYRFADG